MVDDMVVDGCFNVLVVCVLLFDVDDRRKNRANSPRDFRSKIWGSLEKHFYYYILLRDFVGGPPSGGAEVQRKRYSYVQLQYSTVWYLWWGVADLIPAVQKYENYVINSSFQKVSKLDV